MAQRITNDELERALAEAVDEHGVDRRLADATARMSDEDRRRSEENLRRSLAEARASLARATATSPEGALPRTRDSATNDELTIAELEAHLASGRDVEGNDCWLADETARMTPEQLRSARANIDRWVARARATLRRRRREL